ncbi:carotenoid ester lipase precursor [Amylostereum chailletii]|nr:carotenoid ester lipase precursor [Amylostereum chailletii]
MPSNVLLLVIAFVGCSVAAPTDPASRSVDPTITLDHGTFTGANSGAINSFLGIPFALPPLDDLRFQLPRPNAPYTGTHNATAFGHSCIQQSSTVPIPSGLDPVAIQFLESSGGSTATSDSEDCLTVNVVAPADATVKSKLPVVVWIYGGGFEDGSSSTFNGSAIVQRSLDLKVPVIFVSLNYRYIISLSSLALGFLDGKEVREAGIGNLGLQDQRLALRWIQKYISTFGGDPRKVTIWGESAGAISVALQMLTNGGNTEGLFRAAFMQSGSPIPNAGTIGTAQTHFDQLVDNTNCTTSEDKLACLRKVPLDTLRSGINASPSLFSFNSLELAWTPRNDGTFLRDTPMNLVLQGSVANIPFITGDCDDEGTLFSLSNANLTTDDEVHDYMSTVYLQGASSSSIDKLLELYPQDPAQGSPFDTGDLNQVTPQFKRLAAIQGDIVFQAPRRFFLNNRSARQKTWSFLSKRLKALPDFGSVHGSDISNVFGPGDMTDYLIRFAAFLNPNGATGIAWPQYDVYSRQLLTFLDGDVPLTLTSDTYRKEQMEFVTELSLAAPA